MVTLDEATYALIRAEINAVHALCDRALVPRVSEGETLSMAQRVNVMESCYRGVIRDIGKVDPTVLH
jgi:hypothetical protein